MVNILITFLRRLDPASEYAMGFEANVDAFSWGQLVDGLQGPANGVYVVWACYGQAAIGEYRSRALAVEHLVRARTRSRTLLRIIGHNGWRLRLWAQRWARHWRDRSGELDAVIA